MKSEVIIRKDFLREDALWSCRRGVFNKIFNTVCIILVINVIDTKNCGVIKKVTYMATLGV